MVSYYHYIWSKLLLQMVYIINTNCLYCSFKCSILLYKQSILLINSLYCYIVDTVFIICFSLIMLSFDLSSPHIKNKMSKREFIKNVRRAAREISEELAGHLYDNIYLVGHIAPRA